jgi:hypothetical protein
VCKKLHRVFWEVNEKKVSQVMRVLENNQPILLKRGRELRKPRFVSNRGILELGRLVIVMYKTPKEVKR